MVAGDSPNQRVLVVDFDRAQTPQHPDTRAAFMENESAILDEFAEHIVCYPTTPFANETLS